MLCSSRLGPPGSCAATERRLTATKMVGAQTVPTLHFLVQCVLAPCFCGLNTCLALADTIRPQPSSAGVPPPASSSTKKKPKKRPTPPAAAAAPALGPVDAENKDVRAFIDRMVPECHGVNDLSLSLRCPVNQLFPKQPLSHVDIGSAGWAATRNVASVWGGAVPARQPNPARGDQQDQQG